MGLIPLLILPAILAFGAWFGPLIQAAYPDDTQSVQQVGGVIAGWIFLLLVSIDIIVLTVGWVYGFPRWSFTYLAVLLIVSAMLSPSATPGLVLFGHTFSHDELWGWRAWVPLGVWLVVSVAITRSFRPAWQLLNMVNTDWTRLSFGLYGLLPVTLLIIFDEVHGEDGFVAFLCLLLAGGALGYLRVKHTGWRFFCLVAAVGVVWFAAAVYLGIYWDGRLEFWMRAPADGWSNFSTTLVSGVIILLLLCLPALASRVLARIQRGTILR